MAEWKKKSENEWDRERKTVRVRNTTHKVGCILADWWAVAPPVTVSSVFLYIHKLQRSVKEQRPQGKIIFLLLSLTHTHTHTHAQTNTHTHTHAHTHTYICRHTCSILPFLLQAHTHIHACAYTQTYTHTHTAYRHTYSTHINTHTRTGTHTDMPSLKPGRETDRQKDKHKYTCTQYTNINTHTCTHARTHARAHTHTHTLTNLWKFTWKMQDFTISSLQLHLYPGDSTLSFLFNFGAFTEDTLATNYIHVNGLWLTLR